MVRASFREPIRFKTNSTQHEQLASGMGLAYVSQEALLREQRFLPLNTGRAEGRLRIVRSEAQLRTLSPRDIPVLDEVPIALTPVAGLVTQRPSTLLSHVNLLAKGWGIPNVYVRDAQRRCASTTDAGWRWRSPTTTTRSRHLTRPARTPSAHGGAPGGAQPATPGPERGRAQAAGRRCARVTAAIAG